MGLETANRFWGCAWVWWLLAIRGKLQGLGVFLCVSDVCCWVWRALLGLGVAARCGVCLVLGFVLDLGDSAKV